MHTLQFRHYAQYRARTLFSHIYYANFHYINFQSLIVHFSNFQIHVPSFPVERVVSHKCGFILLFQNFNSNNKQMLFFFISLNQLISLFSQHTLVFTIWYYHTLAYVPLYELNNRLHLFVLCKEVVKYKTFDLVLFAHKSFLSHN